VTGYYYRRLGADGDCQTFESTDITSSNWDPAIQHGSPPPGSAGHRVGARDK